jgi:hypothetical protein
VERGEWLAAVGRRGPLSGSPPRPAPPRVVARPRPSGAAAVLNVPRQLPKERFGKFLGHMRWSDVAMRST